MITETTKELEACREREADSLRFKGRPIGAFVVRYKGIRLNVIAYNGDELVAVTEGYTGELWEHVSVSIASRCPTWEEMQYIKTLFWLPEETVLQFHPRHSEYVNNHPYTLHLWRKPGVNHPLPPRECV